MTGMKPGVNKNLLGGVLFLILGTAVLLAVPRQIPEADPGMIGPRYVPQLMAIGIVILSLVLIAQGIFTKGLRIRLRDVVPTVEAAGIAALVAAWVAALALGAGYLPATIGFAACGLAILRVRGVMNYLIAAVFTLALFVLFAFVLRVRLP